MPAVKGRAVIWESGLCGVAVSLADHHKGAGDKMETYKPLTEEFVRSPRSRMTEELSGTCVFGFSDTLWPLPSADKGMSVKGLYGGERRTVRSKP